MTKHKPTSLGLPIDGTLLCGALHPETDLLILDAFTWSIQEIAQNCDIQGPVWQMPPLLTGHLSHEQMLGEYINHLILSNTHITCLSTVIMASLLNFYLQSPAHYKFISGDQTCPTEWVISRLIPLSHKWTLEASPLSSTNTADHQFQRALNLPNKMNLFPNMLI